ncbi:MAG: hypothetical protein ABFD83_08015 [Armatimonadota bacterium]
MRHVHIIMFTLAIVLAAAAVSAQTCPPATQECKPACPPCISGCPAASQAVSAALGAGPASNLQNLCSADFDKAYMQNMYQLHTTIAAFTTQGIEQTTDKNLRDLSNRVRDEQTSMNEKLSAWARTCNICPLPIDYAKVQAIVNTLPKCDDCNFNTEYARTLSMLLSQQRDADQLAVAQSPTKQLRDAASCSLTATQKEINSLVKWIGDKVCPSTTCPTTCPTPCPTPCPKPCP